LEVAKFIQNRWKYPDLYKMCGGTYIYKQHGQVPDVSKSCAGTQITVSSHSNKPKHALQMFPSLTAHIISETKAVEESKYGQSCTNELRSVQQTEVCTANLGLYSKLRSPAN
jgi:hypothetical protein